MNLFDKLLSQVNQSQPPSQPDALAEYHRRLAQEQQLQAMNALMGLPLGGLGSYGVAGSLTRNGLGSVKPTAPISLPESTIVSAVAGWRRWSITMFGTSLMSNNGTYWEPFQCLAAECTQRQNCRGIHCSCGIYAYKTRERAATGENAPSEITHVWGEVWLWGRIIECEHGFRAQFAYPKAIVDTGGIAQQVAITYGIKVIPRK